MTLGEYSGAARAPRHFFLWGLLLGAVAGILVGHPLFMMVFNLHEYLDNHAPLALGEAILHSFSFRAWPLTLLFALSGAFFVGMLGGLYQHLEDNRLSYQAQLRSLAVELSLVEERERRRIAIQLHENIGQILAFAQIKLGALAAEGATQDLAADLNEVREHINQTIQYARSLTLELSPPILYELGFEEAIEWLARDVQKNCGTEIDVQREMHPIPLTDEARILLFLVVRELLTNVATHAQARHAKVVINREGGRLRIQVEDDGVGFDVAKSRAAGFGLFSIRERLDHIGGHLKVKSKPGHGTLVTLTIPLMPED